MRTLQTLILGAAVVVAGLWATGAQAQITNNAQPGDIAVISPAGSGGICGATCVTGTTGIPQSFFAKSSDVSSLSGQVGSLNTQVGQLARRMNRESEGVALSIAQSRGANLAPDKKFGLSVGFGGFDAQAGAGFNAIGMISEGVYLSGGLGIGLNTGVVGGGGAVSFQW
jgi:hypothetical protein